MVGSVNTIRLSKDSRRWVSQHNKAKTLGMEHVNGRKFTEKKEGGEEK